MERNQRLFDVLRSRRRNGAKVYGRHDELCALQEAFDRVSEMDSPSSEFVLIHGSSGCGKSSIVSALMDWTRKERDDVNVYFGSGKYDQFVSNEPFAALVAASNELCKKLLDSGPTVIKTFTGRLRSMVGSDAKILTTAIPSLAELIGDEDSIDLQFSSLSQAFTRFKLLWRSFLLTVSICSDVTVLFLDDVQWADSNSLDLIHSMTKIARARNMLLIFAFRDDVTIDNAQDKRLMWCFSVDESFQTTGPKEEMRRLNSREHSKLTIPMTDMKLSNLLPECMDEMVAGLLYSDDDSNREDKPDAHRTRALSRVIFSRTSGNPFFALHYTHYLTAIGLLRTQDDGETWEWDLDAIEHQEDAPETIPELLAKIIALLPEATQTVLIVASHVGFHFSSTLLEQESLVPEEEEEEGKSGQFVTSDLKEGPIRVPLRASRAYSIVVDKSRVLSILEEAVKLGLLERRGKVEFVFPHDQIQTAFHKSLSGEPRKQKELHLKIGKAQLDLIRRNQTESETVVDGWTLENFNDRTLFTAVDNLNKGSACIDDPSDRMELITLNYKAGRAALRRSALEGAVQYVRSGISLLNRDRWESQYETTLNLYLLAAKLEHCTGNSNSCDFFLSEIQARGRSIEDKLPSYIIETDTLGAVGKSMDALRLGATVLNMLDEPMPPNPGLVRVLLELRKASKEIKAADFRNMKAMQAPKKVAAMSVLSSLFLYSYVVGDKTKNFTALVILKMVRISIAHGLSVYTPFGLAGYSNVQMSLGDLKGAKQTGDLALELTEVLPGAEPFYGRTSLLLHALVTPWTGCSMQRLQSEYLRSYQISTAHGDVDFGYYAAHNYLLACIKLGTPLKEVHSEYNRFLLEIDEYKLDHPKSFYMSTWQVIRMLLGIHPNRTSAGDVLEITQFCKELSQSTNDFFTVFYNCFHLFGKIILGTVGQCSLLEDKEALKNIRKNFEAVQMFHLRGTFCLIEGLASFEIWRQTSKRKFFKIGRCALRGLQTLSKTEAPHIIASYQLLSAEYQRCSLTRKHANHSSSLELIKGAFLEAATTAGTTACRDVPVEALSYELLGAMLREHKEPCLQYRDRAMDIYRNWGATEKVRKLHNEGDVNSMSCTDHSSLK